MKIEDGRGVSEPPPQDIRANAPEERGDKEPPQAVHEKDVKTTEANLLAAEDVHPEPSHPHNEQKSHPEEVEDERGKEGTERSEEKVTPDEATATTEVQETGNGTEQRASYDDLNFDSMFGEADTSKDANKDVDNGLGKDVDNNLNFDLDLKTDKLGGTNPFGTSVEEADDLEILPGLESYANASGDDFNMLALPASTTGGQAGVNNQFDLPEIQGGSSFDDLFADGDLGGDAALMDLDLEDSFFNT